MSTRKNKMLLSLLLHGVYNEFAAVKQIRKGNDYGRIWRKSKRIREEKGITQQTLADYLYVTRQAVSRWEGGSRYLDLLAAKNFHFCVRW